MNSYNALDARQPKGMLAAMNREQAETNDNSKKHLSGPTLLPRSVREGENQKKLINITLSQIINLSMKMNIFMLLKL